MWVPPEVKDPVLLHHPTRKGIGYFGAVRIRDGKFVYSREVHRFNADRHVLRVSEKAPAVLQWGRAPGRGDPGQCPIPSCRPAPDMARQMSKELHVVVHAALHPGAQPH